MGRILSIALGLSLFSSLAVAGTLTCAKNQDDQNIKRICLLPANGKGKTPGFLLYNANGTKSYLVVVREKATGYAVQEYGHREWHYTVKRADSSLRAQDNVTSMLKIIQYWEYSDGGTYITGQTPGGRRIHAVIEEGDSA